MVVFGSTYRNIQNVVLSLNLPWNNEPYPDHCWISRTFKKIPLIYLECVLILVILSVLERIRLGGKAFLHRMSAQYKQTGMIMK